MDLWHLLLFVAASLLALRSFVTLTSYHERFTLHRLSREQQAASPPGGASPTPSNNAAA